MRNLTGSKSRLLVALASLAIMLLSSAPLAAQGDPLIEIRQLYTAGLEAYDFFEYNAAEESFAKAIEIAKANSIKDPVVGKVYLAKGILFHARFKDAAPEVARDKTFDEFVAAVSNDYDIAIPEDYSTPELEEILKEAREIVPKPDGYNNTTLPAGEVSIAHDPVSVADACMPITVRVKIPPHPDAYRAYLNYLPTDAVTYEQVELNPTPQDPEVFAAEIPIEATASTNISYYIEVVNRQNGPVASAGSRTKPNEITIIGECDLEKDVPLVQINVGAGTGMGFASGDSERCKTTEACYGEGQDPDRFEGVRAGMAPAPFHVLGEVLFNINEDFQVGAYLRAQIIEFGLMFGVKARYFVVNDDFLRFYTGLGAGYGKATYVVDLGPDFNNFRDVVNAEGPAHVGLNLGITMAFTEVFGMFVDVYTPIHFPDFTFHFDASLGPMLQF